MQVSAGAIHFGTILGKKPVKVNVVAQNDTTTRVQNLRDGSTYPVPTDQFKASYTPVTGKKGQYESKPGEWRDFKIVPRGETYQDIDGKRKKAQHGILIREPGQVKAFYEPSVYYAIGCFEPPPGDAEAQAFYQEMQNIGHIHGPLSPAKIRGMSQTIFQNRPYVFAVAGYSDADDAYEKSSTAVLKGLVGKLGAGKMGIVTSPTAMDNSIDASSTIVAQKYHVPIVYVTAQGYIQYIEPDDFPRGIDKNQYAVTPKLFGKTPEEYSQSTAEASTVSLVIGGRNASVQDAVNGLKKGNKLVVIRDKALTRGAWDINKQRVDNASEYIAQQIEAYQNGKVLPFESRGGLDAETLQAIEAEHGRLDQLVQVVDLDTRKQGPKAIQKALGDHFMYFLTR